ncbi:hypothetical protein GCM10008905_31330 [Clostridium malenominatum]|uniref:Uncharacterized protein n=1 Tax=Clostridium malenominatum TaxID=1539 RepID=A0ABN1J6H9_9CLOT
MNSTREELFQMQSDLQMEASELEKLLNLNELLQRVGEPIRVGSSALGLMVWRDLDITVVCNDLNIEKIADIAKDLMASPYVRELKFKNDTDTWNEEPHIYPDGFYFSLKCKSNTNHIWKVDIWFVDQPERQPDLKHIKTIPSKLTPEKKEIILRIKKTWAEKPEYGRIVTSYLIYKAVLDENIKSLDEFNLYLKK